MTNDYIYYGCGISASPTWRNFDISPTLRLQKLPIVGRFFRGGKIPNWPTFVEYGDIIKGLPLKTGECKAIYCSHTLEHLSLADLRTTLRNTYSYLETGGVFRFVLPDLEVYIKKYLASDEPDAAIKFIIDLHMGREIRPRGAEAILRGIIGNSQHLWMWDYKSLAVELEQIGFREIRRAEFNDSEHPIFLDVEEQSRWENCLGIECFK